MLTASVNLDIAKKFVSARANIERRANVAANRAASRAANEFMIEAARQVSYPRALLEQRVQVDAAQVVVIDEPVGLEQLPHRRSQAGGVDVQLEPGRVVHLRRAFIGRQGYILGIRPDGRFGRLYAPSVSQIAATELPRIGERERERFVRDV